MQIPLRLFTTPEHVINIKEQETNRTAAYVETITDLLDSPNNDQQSQPCQLRVSRIYFLNISNFFLIDVL